MASQSLVSSTRWLRPPRDGMKIMPASVSAARFCASWPAAEWRGAGGDPPRDPPDPAPAGERPGERLALHREAREDVRVRAPELLHELTARGYDVAHARVHGDDAEVRDGAPAAAPDHEVARPQRIVGGR